MENYKFSLAKRGKSKCPECGRTSFVLYINNNTGEPLHSSVGRCDRNDHCGYHYSPKKYFDDNNIAFDKTPVVRDESHNNRPATQTPVTSYIDAELMKRSLTGYDHNNLVQYLIRLVGHEMAMTAVAKYNVGTARNGGACFWQVDLSKICNVTVSDLIERSATEEERTSGFDIADYLTRFKPSDFKSPKIGEYENPDNAKKRIRQSIDETDSIKSLPAKPVSASPINIPKGNTLAFLSADGKIYIPTKRQTYTYYESADHLISPTVLPRSVPIYEVDTSTMQKIFINY